MKLSIEDEVMILEDGKFYPVIRTTPKKEEPENILRLNCGLSDKDAVTLSDRYGPRLLEKRDSTLKKYLEKEVYDLEAVRDRVIEAGIKNPGREQRIEEVKLLMDINEKARAVMR